MPRSTGTRRLLAVDDCATLLRRWLWILEFNFVPKASRGKNRLFLFHFARFYCALNCYKSLEIYTSEITEFIKKFSKKQIFPESAKKEILCSTSPESDCFGYRGDCKLVLGFCNALYQIWQNFYAFAIASHS